MQRWLAIAGLALSVAGCGRALLSADDAVCFADGRAVLVAWVEREPLPGLRSDLDGVTVQFRAGGRDLGQDVSEAGKSGLVATLTGGRPSEFQASARIDGHEVQASGLIHSWDSERTVVVVDIDGTLLKTELSSILRPEGDETSMPIIGARQAICRIAETCHIAYVTSRPRFLTAKTRAWLEQAQFPPGPVITSPGLRRAIRQEKAKRRNLVDLRNRWPNLAIGIGDSEIDSHAYGATGLLSLIVDRHGNAGDVGPHALVFADWPALERFFAENLPDLRDPTRVAEIVQGRRAVRKEVLPYRPD